MNLMKKVPLIENILIISVPSLKLISLKSQTLDYIKKNYLTINGEINENYQSSFIPYQHDLNFYQQIIQMAFPNGFINLNNINELNNTNNNFISFSLYSKSNLKHITCLKIAGILELNSKENVSVYTGIVLVSPFDIYECHKEILTKFNDIIIDYFSNFKGKKFEKKVNFDDNEVSECSILDFYISFLLNSLYFDINYRKSLCISNIDNKYNRTFFKFHIDIPEKINNILPLKDYNLSIILDKFYIEDLLKIYTGLLLEFKIILIFDDYKEINYCIQSLLTITYPLNKSEFNIFSYITLNDEFLINLPCSIIGVPINIKIYNIESDVIIYSLVHKKFIKYPQNKIPSIHDQLILNELKSKLYETLAEKLEINTEMDFELTDLGEMFNNNICTKINSNIYLNLKICSIFFKTFLLLMKDLNKYINFNKAEKLFQGEGEIVKMTSFFDLESFKKNYKNFHKYLYNTKIFSNFIEKYAKYYNKKPKYIFINKILSELINLNSFSKQSLFLDEKFKNQIKQGILDYYNFQFINLNYAVCDYYKNGFDEFERNGYFKFPSLEQLIHFEKTKINKWRENYNKFIDQNETFLKQMELYNYINE